MDNGAVIDLDFVRLRAAVRDAFEAFRDAQDTAQRRRFELGRALVEARQRWPRSGPNARGWGEFLASEGIDQDVALRAMEYAGWVEANVPVDRQVSGKLPTLAEAGIRPPRENEAPPSTEQVGAPPAEPSDRDLNPDNVIKPDRNTWCTPLEITDALGEVDLDPCANERSHVNARETYRLDRGQDGIELAVGVDDQALVFINPPYGKHPVTKDSLVTPWVAAYKRKRFIFLLRFDPSTDWFHELWEACERVLFLKERIEFEPPPGVEDPNSNPYPHALLFARADDVPAALAALCFDTTVNHERTEKR